MITIEEIKSHPNIEDALDMTFDFWLSRADKDLDWIEIKPHIACQAIAGKASGCVFLACGDGEAEHLPILFFTSEGQAGCIASNLSELLGIMIQMPYWSDVLKYSGGGQIEEMRKAALTFEQDCEEFDDEYEEEYPNLFVSRELITANLDIPVLQDPVKILHDNVHGTQYAVYSDLECEPLFNKFTV